jgi:hypothetical protein
MEGKHRDPGRVKSPRSGVLQRATSEKKVPKKELKAVQNRSG